MKGKRCDLILDLTVLDGKTKIRPYSVGFIMLARYSRSFLWIGCIDGVKTPSLCPVPFYIALYEWNKSN